PYVNRNHYAGLLEMLIPFALVAALSRSLPPEKKALMAFAAVIMGGSIFLSRSRGGLLALAVQLLVLVVVYFRRGSSRGVIAALLAVGVTAGGFVVWLDRGKMISRLENMPELGMESVEGVRRNILRDGLKMAADRPLTGWGLGAFPVVYPQYRSFYTSKFVNQAHNDYLQVLVETGVTGFALVLWGIFALYREAFRKMRRAPAALRSPVLAAVVGCTGLLVHSFLDFNLHIPANAALFAVLCAAVSTRMAGEPRTADRAH
ncbi:MAG: O-antigen ligase family protein, partial [Terriglobales bacterium]